MCDPYQILGLPYGASRQAIQEAYRRLARRYHPDLNRAPGAEERMKEINWAFDVLSGRGRFGGHAAGGSHYGSRPGAGYPPGSGYRSTPRGGTASSAGSGYRPPGTGPTSPGQGYQPPRNPYTPPAWPGAAQQPDRSRTAWGAWVILFVLARAVVGAIGQFSQPSYNFRTDPQAFNFQLAYIRATLTALPQTLYRTPPPTSVVPMVVVETLQAREAACRPWQELQAAQVGQTVCLYGEMAQAYPLAEDGYRYELRFDAPDMMLLVSLTQAVRMFPAYQPGDCRQVQGVLEELPVEGEAKVYRITVYSLGQIEVCR